MTTETTESRWNPTTEREHLVKDTWRQVNEIACSTENMAHIRNLVSKAGCTPGAHVGTPPENFTPLMVAEWVLGNWADMIDHGSPFMNMARNISLHQYSELTGEPDPEWTVGTSPAFVAEVNAIIERKAE